MKTVSVFDVAKFILNELGTISAIKLQKLVYYCQVWYLVEYERKALFEEPIEAWINGPVVRSLYNDHRKQDFVSFLSKGNIDNLSNEQKNLIRKVLKYYKDKSILWLITHTHQEQPWLIARKGFRESERCENIITKDYIYSFYKDKKIEDFIKE